MDVIPIILLLAASLASTSCQKIPSRAIASIMQKILSPKTTEQFAEAIRGAAISKTPLAELMAHRKRNIISEAGLARKLARQEVLQEVDMPRNGAVQQAIQSKVIHQRPNDIVMPKKAIVQNSIPSTIVVQKPNEAVIPMNIAKQKSKELPTPTKIVIKKPELAMPKKVLVQNTEGIPNRRILVDKANAIPMLRNLLLQIDNSIASKGLLPNNIAGKSNGVQRSVTDNKSVPKVMVQQSVTSPVLPLTTVSNALPQSKGQFLRKIPIPPPTI